MLRHRTTAITQPERLTQRKSKRTIEGLACIAWFVGFFGLYTPLRAVSFDNLATVQEVSKHLPVWLVRDWVSQWAVGKVL